MRASGNSSPMRLAVWAGLGSLMVAGTFPLGFFVLPRHDALSNLAQPAPLWTKPWLMLLFVAPFVIGMAVLLWAETRLRRGVKGSVWTEAELSALRKRLEFPVWQWLGIPFFAIYIALIVRGVHSAALFFLMLWPFQVVMQLHQIVRPKAESAGFIRLVTSSPIRSEHWGSPSRDGSVP